MFEQIVLNKSEAAASLPVQSFCDFGMSVTYTYGTPWDNACWTRKILSPRDHAYMRVDA